MDIYIWKDGWIPTQNGNKLWSPPIDLDDSARVFKLIDHTSGRWNEALIRDNFYPFEAEQILAIPLPSRDTSDYFYWQGTKNGVYKVSSAYHLARAYGGEINGGRSSPAAEKDEVWTKLWKLNAQPQCKIFIWRLFHNGLP